MAERDDRRRLDFFISYSPGDERWAAWIGWQLEAAGHRVLIQAWDFVPGTNFIDFMDRGIRDAAVVVALLSRNYLKSRYGAMEWQAALRSDPGKLVTVRIEDCPLDGLLATITYLDLTSIGDERQAALVLIDHLRHVLAGRAKPIVEPGFPPTQPTELTGQPDVPGWATREPARTRRTPVAAPGYPPSVAEPRTGRDSVTVLHVSGPRFGRELAEADEPLSASELQSRIWANVTRLADAGVSMPELIVVSGDLTESARPREIEHALTFLTGLRVLFGLESHRLIVVPGGHDVSKAACLSYFARCEARDVQPQEPFFPKLEHYAELFAELYEGLDGPAFDVAQPWTLFAIPELRLAVAGLNSTMAVTHRQEDNYGWIGTTQAAWFAERLHTFELSGWLRLGVVRHDPTPGARSAGLDPILLRDAATLEGMLGHRLNLLLHGTGLGSTATDILGSGLPAVRAPAPGREEIIRLTPDGLTRYSFYEKAIGEPAGHVSKTWHAVDGTFARPAEELAAEELAAEELAAEELAAEELAAEVPARELERAAPHSLLLELIAEVCATRHPHAKIRRVEADPPHLLVTTRHEEGFNPQFRVAAHVGELTREGLETFLRHDPDPGSELVYQGSPPAQTLRDEAARRGVRLSSFIEFQGMLDLTDYVAKQTTRIRNDRWYPSDLYVPQHFRELDRGGSDVHDDLAGELIRLVSADDARFILVLGDFGRGKTFMLREVARRIAETMPHLVPILIELRALDKAHSVNGLVAAHLANHGEELIDLKAFNYMLREGRIVLLFDGFDELVTKVTYDKAADHLDTLLKAAQGKAKIVVTSRTQYFKSNAQVFTALGERVGLLPHCRILSVEDFTPAQIRTYLVNHYLGNEHEADARLRLINNVQDLAGLAQNPRMLGFIAELDAERLRATTRAQHALSAASLYREILHSWLSHETERATSGPVAGTGIGLAELRQTMTTLAVRLWESGESYLRLAELTEVADTLTSLAEGRLSRHQTAHAMGAGSLLVRTDEGLFGFIHSSVMEWLVASVIANCFDAGDSAPVHLEQRPLSQLTVDFLCDLADTRACQRWADDVLADSTVGEVAKANAIKINAWLCTSVVAAHVRCDPDEATPGQPSRVWLAVRAADSGEPLAEPVRLRVLLDAVPAVVAPVSRVMVLAVDRTAEPVEFEVVPPEARPLPMVFRVYRESDSHLLVEVTAELPVRAPGVRS